ncbi:hypothetical protein B0H14DRAFT_3130116 [Mycena olivaceomarginata]|nr:hypothetical protein B0H14DRAFT_3130116 [Mycena olivaceomarginata]
MVSESPTSPQSTVQYPSTIYGSTRSQDTRKKPGSILKRKEGGDYRDLHDCSSPEDALRLLTGLADTPHIAQQKRTRLAFSNVFKFVLTVNDAVAELATSLVIRLGLLTMIFPLTSMSSKYLEGKLFSWPSDFAQMQNMQDRLSALAELFFKFEQFFCRLDLRRGISYPVRDQEILTRICAEFLHILALAQKIIGPDSRQSFRGRLQRIRHRAFNFREALLDNSDIKSAMYRLDELTNMELQITVAQTFQAVAATRDEVQNVQTMSARNPSSSGRDESWNEK